MKVTVSMITLNEERAVAKVVEDIRRVVPDAEIFLVDSSRDRTAEIAQELGCRVFKQFPPKGYGPAMDRAVRDASGEVVVTDRGRLRPRECYSPRNAAEGHAVFQLHRESRFRVDRPAVARHQDNRRA